MGQSAAAAGSRFSRRRCSHMPSGISSSPRTKSPGMATKTTRPAYGLRWNRPVSSAIIRAAKVTAHTVAISAPTTVSGCRMSALFVTGGLLQAGEVGHERVEVCGRQVGVLAGHHRLLGRLGLRRHLGRIDDPLLDVGCRQLGPDAVERARRLALARDGVTEAALLRGVDLRATRGVLRGSRSGAGEDEGE